MIVNVNSVLLWRLHIHWTYRRKVLIAPIALLLISAAMSGLATLDRTRQILAGDPEETPGVEIWALIAYLFALFCAILVSVMTVGRLCWISLRTEVKTVTWRKAAYMLTESGAL
ncbi:hypothetical protein FRB94_005328 [Tulasnella sp. JGI-2019a]|nr:hypothetical protein FRB93_002786 [Tulasnella sp. JGI-2019a]KAG9000582.1 hypothetical protein FRB94_005328 [Tulasnella sp. JGI-2019a]KAG9030012.1 hypothetical protein FRB95_004658 [Tulasnella sp. JGI-2019a]